jgi:tetratricopeptide (TPR) repeat protein
MKSSGIILTLLSIIICLSSCKNQEKAIKQPNDNDIKVAQMVIDAATQREIGNTETACSLYEAIIKQQPENSLAYYQLSSINYEQRNIARAIEYNLKAIELNPKNHWYRTQLAEIYLQTKQIEKAADQYRAIIDLQPNVTEYYMELVAIYTEANMFDKAIEIVNLLEKRQGVNEYCSMLKYKIYKQLGKQEKATKEIEILCKEYPSNVSYLSTLAQNYLSKGEDKKALSLMKKVEEIDSNNIENIVALLELYYKKGEINLAESYIDKLCRNTQMNFEEKNQLILTLYQEKVDNDSFTLKCYMGHLETMAKMYPEEGRLWQFLSIAYMRTFRMADAYIACKKAVEYGVNDLDLFKNCIIVQQINDDPKEIIETCDKALKYYPREVIFYIVKGHNLNAIGEYTSAIEVFEKGLKLKTRQEDYLIDLYNGLAEAHYRAEKYDQAWNFFEKVLEISPNDFPTLNNYAYYLCIENINLDKAEEMSKKTYDAESRNITFADTYAWILHSKGEHLKAKEVLDKFLDSKDNWSATVQGHYEEILNAIK